MEVVEATPSTGSVTPTIVTTTTPTPSSPSTVTVSSNDDGKGFNTHQHVSLSPCPTTPRLVSTPPTPPPSPYTVKESLEENKHEVRTELDLIRCAKKAIEKCAESEERMVKEESIPSTPKSCEEQQQPPTVTVTLSTSTEATLSSTSIVQKNLNLSTVDDEHNGNDDANSGQIDANDGVKDQEEGEKEAEDSEVMIKEKPEQLLVKEEAGVDDDKEDVKPVDENAFTMEEQLEPSTSYSRLNIDNQSPTTWSSPSSHHQHHEADESPQPSYHLKWTKWKGNKCPIVTQNENGPCPLIAIINVLLLKNRIRLPQMMEVITANQLIEYLGDCILENIPKGLKEEEQLNYEQNMHDAIAILPKLQTGLDVNVRFTGVSDFEYTPELIFFDLLHIPLYHGWLVDPNDLQAVTAISNCSYNQLVDKIITNKTSSRPELAVEALIAEQFLEKTASQLTYFGLSQLNTTLKDGELSVLFRNNHFITLYKHKDELVQLVTDQGFLTESRVVWETLNNIENDGKFVDGDFIPVPPKATLTAEDQQAQVDQDYLIALSLQEEQKKEFEKEKEWEAFKSENGLTELNDEEFARKLQEDEKRKAQQLSAYEDKQEAPPSQDEQHLVQQQQQYNNQTSESRNNSRYNSANRRSQSVPSRNKNEDKSGSKCSVM